MRLQLPIISLITFLLFAAFPASFAQSPSTQGVEFFVGFMKNGYRYCNGYSESTTLIASGKRACTVTVSNPNTGWNITQSVAPNAVTTIDIPEEESYHIGSETVEYKGLVINATDTISLFFANEATNSFDASFVLPTSSLLDEYMVQCFVPMTTSTDVCPDNNKSVFLIIATENNTVVDITPRAKTANGRNALTTFSVTLNRGQSYQVISYSGGASGDFSGSIVKARDCKKIAVFNGNVLAAIPSDLTNGLDHIFEQAMPVDYWGKEFVVTSSAERSGGDFVKVTALENGTVVKQNSTTIATISAGENHTFQLPMLQGACFLETSKPCAVNLYQTTSLYDESTLGDPSMVWIAPVEQQIEDIMFSTFEAQSITIHYINVVINSEDVGNITLNNNNISSNFSVVNGNPDYMYARIPINPGSHRLQSSSGFTAHVYGYGYAQGYAYSVGSSTVNLSRELFLNGLSGRTLAANTTFCQFELLDFTYTASGEYDSVYWDMGDGNLFYQDSVIGYQYENEGVYTVKNITKLEYENCMGSLYDTLTLTFRIKGTEHIDFHEDHCVGNYCGHGTSFLLTQDSTLVDSSEYYSNCEIKYYHIHAKPSYRHSDRKLFCSVPFPYNYADHTITESGVYEIPLQSVYGCDSIIDLEVVFEDTYIHIVHEGQDLCVSQSLILETVSSSGVEIEWSTGETTPSITVTEPGVYSVTATSANCMGQSSVTFPLCDFYIFIPNAITPGRGEGINDVFQIPWVEFSKPLKFEIFIYNRWGALIFHSTDPDFQWDGTDQGGIIQNTMYNYHINLTVPQGKTKTYKGTITVL
ncbi:MAG: gliding motility-associated C-terminal domain-containing protein [Bacteroidales bacterium]|nr:gliding motility-associated C-terminal domain-containing protein [Bacteroidales bacterium]